MCDHVWMRTGYNMRICGYCFQSQTGDWEWTWKDSGKVQHKLVHLYKDDGTMVFDPDCALCDIKQKTLSV